MSTEITKANGVDGGSFETALIGGDLAKMGESGRLNYYKGICESMGLNYLTRPFDYITLNGKLTLYANRGCADQLRKINGVSLTVVAREKIGDLYSVSVRAEDKSGRVDEATGVVTLTGLKGDALANALMKAETKAKRRATLSICGLGWLDESEIETIPDARRVSVEQIEPSGEAAVRADAVADNIPKESDARAGQLPTLGELDKLAYAASIKAGNPPSEKSLWALFFKLKELGHEWPYLKKPEQLVNIREVAKKIAGDASCSSLTVSNAIKAVESRGLAALEGRAAGEPEYHEEEQISFDDDDIPF